LKNIIKKILKETDCIEKRDYW